MKPVFLDFNQEQNLPAKKNSNNLTEVKEIILKRIEEDFYNSELVKEKVLEKLINEIVNPTQS